MSYHTEIIFGKDQVRKYQNDEAFTDFEKSINFKQYFFETQEERSAFYKGIGEAMGWLEYEVINEYEVEKEQEKEDESKFDYWAFIEKYYPKYSSCDNVLLSDILARKLNGGEVCESDEEYIKDWDVRKELFEVEKELLSEAFANFFNKQYPENVDK
jgi:hypothetical protein